MKTHTTPLLTLLLAHFVTGCATTPEDDRQDSKIYAVQASEASFTESFFDDAPVDPDRYRPSEFELSIFNDPSYKKRFVESYIATTDTEPPLTFEEQEAILDILDHMAKDRTDRALRQIKKFDGPDGSAVFDYTLAGLYLQDEQLDKAIERYKVAIDKYPSFRRAWSNIAQAYSRKGDHKNAASAFVRVLELGTGNAIEYGLLAYAHFNAENYVAAESAYRMASLLDPNTKQWMQGLAESLFRQQRYAESVAFFNTLIEKDPSDPSLWMLQARSYLGLEQPTKAAENLELVDRLGKSTPDTLNLLGDIYVNVKLYGLAANSYARAMVDDENGTPVRAIRAASDLAARGALEETGRLVEQIESVHGAKLDEEQKITVLRLRARVAVHRDATNEQAAILEEIVSLDPLDGEALILLGKHYSAADKLQKGILFLEQAASIDDFEADAKQAHADALIDRDRYSEALPLLRRVYELEPREALKDYIDAVERRSRSEAP